MFQIKSTKVVPASDWEFLLGYHNSSELYTFDFNLENRIQIHPKTILGINVGTGIKKGWIITPQMFTIVIFFLFHSTSESFLWSTPEPKIKILFYFFEHFLINLLWLFAPFSCVKLKSFVYRIYRYLVINSSNFSLFMLYAGSVASRVFFCICQLDSNCSNKRWRSRRALIHLLLSSVSL